jgi:hypothetical protein
MYEILHFGMYRYVLVYTSIYRYIPKHRFSSRWSGFQMLHRHTVRDALVALFETLVPESETTARAVLSKVLCNPAIIFDKPILDITSNRHLEALARPGMPSCVWETRAEKVANVRTVLDPIIHDGHENVTDFIGTHCI